MDVALDMSLDDMIKKSKNERFRGGGQGCRPGHRPGGSSAAGGRLKNPIYRGPLRMNAGPSSYNIPQCSVDLRSYYFAGMDSFFLHRQSFRKTKNFRWGNEFLDDSLKAVGMPGIENGAKLYISNLDQGVSNDEYRELFSEIGKLRRYAVHYDQNGRPCGSAEVVYSRRSDVFAAHRRYNNGHLDGKPMKLEIAGAKNEAPHVPARGNVFSSRPGKVPRRVPLAAVNRGAPMVRGRGHGGGWGRGRKKPPQGGVVKSVDVLNKELDEYHEDAMHTD